MQSKIQAGKGAVANSSGYYLQMSRHFFGFCFILFYFILRKLQLVLNNSFAFRSFRIQVILVGQGQGPVPEKMITNATKTGDWVFLQVRKGRKLISEFVWGKWGGGLA